jgi:hypothetical protein
MIKANAVGVTPVMMLTISMPASPAGQAAQTMPATSRSLPGTSRQASCACCSWPVFRAVSDLSVTVNRFTAGPRGPRGSNVTDGYVTRLDRAMLIEREDRGI